MKYTKRNSSQRGAALIVGLVLLAIITLLAVVGMNMSNSELASANSEQLRIRAFQAAEAGIEYGIKDMDKVGTGAVGTEKKVDPKGVTGSPQDIDKHAIDTYGLTYTYRGEASPAPGYSSDYHAFHFSITSEGRSARNTLVTNEVGAFFVNGGGNTGTFEKLPE